MRKIVFYEPSSGRPHVFSKFCLPRLGTLVLGTILKKEGFDVSVYVDDIMQPRMEELLDADLVGLSCITATAPRTYRFADYLRSRGVKVVIGGPHVTFMVDEALTHADYVFRGEAENSIVPLARALGSGRGLESVRGLSFRAPDGEVRHNEPAEPVEDLDELPDPDFSLLRGNFKVAWASRVVPIQTSRGCPHDCSFCSVTKMFGRRYRLRSTERVLDELSSMDLRRKHVFFYDDHFSAVKRRTVGLLEGILARGLRFPWSCQVRADVARDEGLVKLMRKSGCQTVYVGFESVNPATLEAYRKGQSVEDIERCISVLHRHGIRIHGMFVLGADTDTVDTVRETSRFTRKTRIESVQFLALTPLPGTPFFEEMERSGRLVIRDWSFYDAHHVVYDPAGMSAYELQIEIIRAFKRFYSMPRVLKEVLRLRLFEALVKLYGRQVERKWERLSGLFVKEMKGGLDKVRALLETGRALARGGA